MDYRCFILPFSSTPTYPPTTESIHISPFLVRYRSEISHLDLPTTLSHVVEIIGARLEVEIYRELANVVRIEYTKTMAQVCGLRAAAEARRRRTARIEQELETERKKVLEWLDEMDEEERQEAFQEIEKMCERRGFGMEWWMGVLKGMDTANSNP